jgi:hypothetical protein
MSKCGWSRCVGLNIVEGLVKTVDVFDKYTLGGKAELIFPNGHRKERMRKLFREGIPFQACLARFCWVRLG